MRLIDADYLKNILDSGGGESVNINISKSMSLGNIVDTVIQAYRKCLFAELEKVPTAYDVDKVVERLEGFLSGKTDIQKSNIDKILKVTGMSYEECFKEGLDDGNTKLHNNR